MSRHVLTDLLEMLCSVCYSGNLNASSCLRKRTLKHALSSQLLQAVATWPEEQPSKSDPHTDNWPEVIQLELCHALQKKSLV